MKMARVILFTGQMDAMSKFYGEVLGLQQVSEEKGWREFDAGGARIPGQRRRGAKGRRLFSTPRMWPHCVKSWWPRERASAKCGRENFSAFAMEKIRTEIRFNCPTAEAGVRIPPDSPPRTV
jgi:catechol 2,3-dioxygenase-like lactoylglutathione lyase family enzyme